MTEASLVDAGRMWSTVVGVGDVDLLWQKQYIESVRASEKTVQSVPLLVDSVNDSWNVHFFNYKKI